MTAIIQNCFKSSRLILGFFMIILLAACSQSPKERMLETNQYAAQFGWKRQIIQTQYFDVATYAPSFSPSQKLLTIFLEGDGFAFIDRYTPSKDPTPLNPVALKTAITHQRIMHQSTQKTENVAYIARPCQFVAGRSFRNCKTTYWALSRFNDKIIHAINSTIDHLKTKSGAQEIRLIGFSGGGAVAMQLTQFRQDIAQIITFAGNIDHESWTAFHNVTPLRHSRPSTDALKASQHIPQTHFIGEEDSILPPKYYRKLTQSQIYNEKNGAYSLRESSNFYIISDFDHLCCWAQNWSKLMPLFSSRTASPTEKPLFQEIDF